MLPVCVHTEASADPIPATCRDFRIRLMPGPLLLTIPEPDTKRPRLRRRRTREQAPLFFGGTDFAILAEDGRLRTVTGFTDAMPSSA
jgi:hypothetical protein